MSHNLVTAEALREIETAGATAVCVHNKNMTILSTLSKRSLGAGRGNRSSVKSVDVSFALEGFQCLGPDEHVIAGVDEVPIVPPIACQFCKLNTSSHVLGLVDENGYIILYNTNWTGDEAEMKAWQGHNNAVFDVTWVDGEEKLVTASGDQTAVLWDVTRGSKLGVFRGHTSSVRTVTFKPNDKAVFATGSRDGSIMIWDKRCNKTKDGHQTHVNVIRNAHVLQQQGTPKPRRRTKLGPPLDSHQSVTSLVFQSDSSLISAGAGDGCVKIWDTRKNYGFVTADPTPRDIFPYSGTSRRKHGITSLVLDSTNSNLFVSCMDDVIYQYDVVTMNQNPVYQYRGHRNNSFYIKSSISPEDQFLLSGSCDEFAYIWQINKPHTSPVILKGHRAEVSDVKWSPADMAKIVTLSDDNTMRVWRLNRHNRQLPIPESVVVGTSERTHREIGVTAAAEPSESNLSPMLCRTESQPPQQITPDKPYPIKKHMTEGDKPRNGSPSLTDWLKLSAKKTLKGSSITTPLGSEKQSSVTKTTTDNSDTSTKSRPCKRKLVSDDVDERPSKKPHILKNLPSSPFKKCSNVPVLSPLRSDIASPKKCPNSPRELRAHYGSPQKCCSPRKLTIHNSPRPGTTALGYNASPTVGLPNLVLNGEINKINVSSCLGKENSPKKKSGMDWLTKLRIGKLKDSDSPGVNVSSPKRALFDRNTMSPTSRGQVLSQNSENLSDNSGEQKLKTPVKGMKSLHNYFQKQSSPLPANTAG